MYKYPILVGICNTCSGCNLLQDINFKGKQQCKNYLRLLPHKAQEAITQIHKILGIEGDQIKL